jgi:hypothetical protein|tara:strand:- start:1643 stop:3574 length:1932 start_codon:yes stop_codon:yes gene_type:complete
VSYRLNRTDGALLVDLTDGILDTATTDLTLIGKNYKGFGEFLNENFIALLENFASTSQPTNPMVGQLWYDKQDNRLKIYDGATFRSATGSVVSSTRPSNLTTGDLWIDNENNKLYIWDGTDLTLVGPEYSAGQGKSGFEVSSQLDSTDVQRTILKLFLGGTLVGIYSPETFYILPEYAIAGYPLIVGDALNRQLLEKGFNVVSADFLYRGTATSAKGLIDDAGVIRSANNFIPTDANGATTGSLKIKNSAGLSVGVGETEYSILKVAGTTVTLETQQSNSDFAIKVRSGSSFLPAMYVDTSESRVGIWNSNPSYSLDVTGTGRFSSNLTVGGNLLVEGTTTHLNTSTLRVEDKNIELGILDDSTEANDSQIDGGGIIVRSSEGSKDWTWIAATGSWTSNQDINIISGPDNPVPQLKVDGTNILSSTALGSTVTSALGLTRVGTLSELTVDNIKLDAATITRISGTGLSIVAGGDITVDSQNITGLAEPSAATDAATKNYVDVQLYSKDVIISLDVTGLTNPAAIGASDGPKNSIATLLQNLQAAATFQTGTTAYVMATSYTGSTVSGINVNITTSPDTSGVLTKSSIAVDKNNVSSAETVIQDISQSNTASGVVALTPIRYLYEYVVSGSAWTFVSRSLQTVT